MDEVSRPGWTYFIFIMINYIEFWSSLLNNPMVTSCLLQSALMFSRLRWPNLLARQTQHTSWRHQRRHISQRCKCLNWKLTYLLPLSKRCRTPGLSHIQYLKCMRPGLPSELQLEACWDIWRYPLTHIQIVGRSHWWSHAAQTQWALVWVSCVIINLKQHCKFYFAVNLWPHKSREATANAGEMYPENTDATNSTLCSQNGSLEKPLRVVWIKEK